LGLPYWGRGRHEGNRLVMGREANRAVKEMGRVRRGMVREPRTLVLKIKKKKKES